MLLPNVNLSPAPSLLTNKSIDSFLFLPKFPTSPDLESKPKALKSASHASTSTVQSLSKSAIQRIAEKLKTLGSTDIRPPSNPKTEFQVEQRPSEVIPLSQQLPKRWGERTVDPSWSTPENPVPVVGTGSAIRKLYKLNGEVKKERWEVRKKAKEEETLTLAELTLPEAELKRLRAAGLQLRKKLKIGKVGITQRIVNGIHERWREAELVKIKCEDLCRMNMKRTHNLLERKTGGLVVWRSGSNIILYRGPNYRYPRIFVDDNLANNACHDVLSNSQIYYQKDGMEDTTSLDSHCSESGGPSPSSRQIQPTLVPDFGFVNPALSRLPSEEQLVEEANSLLYDLGPRYADWWGYGPPPVDADLLPAVFPGYRKPLRLLPYGMKPKLMNDELTILRRLGRPLPCHFVLGRNRNHQGLANAIVKLWEKCEIAKIAVKRGVQNTSSKIMAEELKCLTGGILLSRDKYFMVFYRGKDFLPSAVSSAIEEHNKYGMHREKQNGDSVSFMSTQEFQNGIGQCLSEEELDRRGILKRDILSQEMKLRFIESTIRRNSFQMSRALEKKARAERLLANLEVTAVPKQPETDKEGIAEEERSMLKKIGLKMKPFLLLGIRGVFDGTIENMHLHWKYRELVKILVNENSIEDAYAIAQTLEAESCGIIVAVERVRKNYAIIIYRGKNYKGPFSLRPQNLLTKREAKERAIEARQLESLKLHVLKLHRNIDELEAHASQLVKNKEALQVMDESKHQLIRGEHAGDSTFTESANCTVASMESLEIREHDNQPMDLLLQYGGRTNTSEQESLSESVAKKTSRVMEVNAECCDLSLSQVKESSSATINIASSGTLSNRDRLLLRKQALKMKKHLALAGGRSTIVTGAAKAIQAHFQKYPLAIIDVKARAEETSVQELVFELEQATGAVLVSREPNKVILYRGWDVGGQEREREH